MDPTSFISLHKIKLAKFLIKVSKIFALRVLLKYTPNRSTISKFKKNVIIKITPVSVDNRCKVVTHAILLGPTSLE